MRPLPRWVAMAVVPVSLLAPLPALAQQDDDELRVHLEEGSPDGDVTVVVTTPPLVIGADVPASAFAVVQGDQRLDHDVVPLTEDGLEVVLVMGARSTASLAAEQQSGAELLRGLAGGGVRVGVVDASAARVLVPMTTDGDRVGRALLEADTIGSPEPTSEPAVDVALEQFSDDASRRAVLLMTDDSGAVDPGLTDRLRASEAALFYIQAAVGASAVPSLVDAAEGSGGRAQTGDLRGLIRTVDQVRTDLTNQYRVQFRSTGVDSAEVRVGAAGRLLKGTVDLTAPKPAPGTTAAAPAAADEDDSGGGGSGVLVALLVLAVLAVLGGLAALVLLRRRRRPDAPTGAPMLIDLRSRPEAGAPSPDEPELTDPGGGRETEEPAS